MCLSGRAAVHGPTRMGARMSCCPKKLQAPATQNANQTRPSSVSTEARASAQQQPKMRNFDVPAGGSGAVPAVSRPPPSPPAVAEPPPEYKSPSYRVSLFDAMKFNGPAPEKINGRLAMVMVLAAAKREAETSQTLLQQLQDPDWGLVVLAVVVVYASFVPVLAGAKDEDFGWLSVRAEKSNGRLAMLAFAAMLGLEYFSGMPSVQLVQKYGAALYQYSAGYFAGNPSVQVARESSADILRNAVDYVSSVPSVQLAQEYGAELLQKFMALRGE